MASRFGYPSERGRKAAEKTEARLGTKLSTTHVPIDALPAGLFPPPRGSVPPRAKASAFEVLTCDLSNDWMRARRDPRILALLEPQFRRRLEELDRVTRGQAARCFCLTGRDTQGRDHSCECPARKP